MSGGTSKIVTLQRKDVNRLLLGVTFRKKSQYTGKRKDQATLLCPGCHGEHTQQEVYSGERNHKRGCWVARVCRALEYDYE